MKTSTTIDTTNPGSPEWERAKYFKATVGIGPAQLGRFADDKLIRTSSIKRPGQTRGIRLFNVRDVMALIRSGIEGA